MTGKRKIQITSISCYNTSEHGHDELYLLCQPDAGFCIRYPSGLGSTISVESGKQYNFKKPFYLEFETEVLVTLWDQDTPFVPSLATYLISYDFISSELTTGKNYKVGIKNPNGAEYKIEVTVIA